MFVFENHWYIWFFSNAQSPAQHADTLFVLAGFEIQKRKFAVRFTGIGEFADCAHQRGFTDFQLAHLGSHECNEAETFSTELRVRFHCNVFLENVVRHCILFTVHQFASEVLQSARVFRIFFITDTQQVKIMARRFRLTRQMHNSDWQSIVAIKTFTRRHQNFVGWIRPIKTTAFVNRQTRIAARNVSTFIKRENERVVCSVTGEMI